MWPWGELSSGSDLLPKTWQRKLSSPGTLTTRVSQLRFLLNQGTQIGPGEAAPSEGRQDRHRSQAGEWPGLESRLL